MNAKDETYARQLDGVRHLAPTLFKACDDWCKKNGKLSYEDFVAVVSGSLMSVSWKALENLPCERRLRILVGVLEDLYKRDVSGTLPPVDADSES